MTRNLLTTHLRLVLGSVALALMILPVSPAVADNGEDGLTGSVEVLYRNVSQDGSARKYDEDFDGLESGTRLSNLTLNWLDSDSNVIDYARLDVSGLGGDPYERTYFRSGRTDSWELTFNQTRQRYLYDLFELVPGEDGAKFNTRRELTNLGLRIFAHEKVQLIFEYQDGRRTGDSLFMKDISRELFRLETPLDQNVKRYTVGANIEAGPVDIVFRQTLRRYDNLFNNTTEGDTGITDDPGIVTVLDSYDWLQNESGGGDWTTLKVHTPLGDRVDLSVSLYGTFLGKEEIDSRVAVDAEGTTWDGLPLSIVGGFSNAELEADTTLIDAELSIKLAEPLDLHLQYRTLDRDLEGVADRDLDGGGTSTLVDVRNDYSIDTLSAILDYRPMRQLRLRAGIRDIDRELIRDGFDGLRNLDFKSDGDEGFIFGVTIKPVKWFRLNAYYEDGDITQPFNAVAPQEREHTRVRATFLPQQDMRIDLGYLDFDNTNTAEDIRDPGSTWDSSIEGNSASISFWHRANERVDYMLRYAEQEIDSSVGIVFDTDFFFNSSEPGDSIFDNDNEQFSGHVNFSWADPWKAYVRYWTAESSGDNIVLGDTLGVVNDEVIDQELTNAEVGLTYTLPSGIFVGGSYRDFDYDDRNDLLDYDGQIFSIRLGTTF